MVESILNSSFTYGRGNRQKASYPISMLALVMQKKSGRQETILHEKILISFWGIPALMDYINMSIPYLHGFQILKPSRSEVIIFSSLSPMYIYSRRSM
jgi:hypothetical protein